MKGYGSSYTMQKAALAARRGHNIGPTVFKKRKRSPRKLEAHEVIAKLKARRAIAEREA